MEELKPCPFCGGNAIFKSEVITNDGYWFVMCENCVAQRDSYDTKNEAAEKWNTRHEQTCKPSKLYEHVFECSECGGMCTDGIPNFCPNCGAKVVNNG